MVRVHATAITPTEFAWQTTFQTRHGEPRLFPINLGHEFSGIIAALGPEVADFSVGDAAKLEGHAKELRKESLKTGIQAHYLFPGITQRMVQTAMRRACMAARLRTRSPHDLRHSYATILLMAHISPAYVQKQLGHHSISMTVDIYGHWIPGEGRERLDNVLRPKAKTGKPLNLVIHGQD